jgi:hypothetical protein
VIGDALTANDVIGRKLIIARLVKRATMESPKILFGEESIGALC